VLELLEVEGNTDSIRLAKASYCKGEVLLSLSQGKEAEDCFIRAFEAFVKY